ncbi:unnamed protein product [Ilex paraguariensis]|uniref:Uncharacterized protein n=1 Tax=Ilex paraguariensis TaxID=185542 RepID=A0ABC8TGS3_9AQUA
MVNQDANEDEEWLANQEAIGTNTATFFSKLYTFEDHTVGGELLSFIPKLITRKENLKLLAFPLMEELKSVVFSMSSDSMPSHDGFSGSGVDFWCDNWIGTGPLILRAISVPSSFPKLNEVLRGESWDLDSVNYALDDQLRSEILSSEKAPPREKLHMWRMWKQAITLDDNVSKFGVAMLVGKKMASNLGFVLISEAPLVRLNHLMRTYQMGSLQHQLTDTVIRQNPKI